MTPLSKNTIQHFTHSHPLTEVSSNTEFLCNGCQTLDLGTRYRCEPCDFSLHQYCANCPIEISSFMHPHALKLVSKPNHVCDLCDESVRGQFYRCEACEFDVHPMCTQLPEYLPHIGHKAHPLRLQPVSNRPCTVCKNICTSWHYTCGICCFDLHLDCVSAPCVEDVKTMSEPTSLKRPDPPHLPTAAPYELPSFNGYYGYGYGGILPPPPHFAPLPYNFVPYAGYGGIPPPPPPHFAPPTYSVPYAHGPGYGVPYGYHTNNGGSQVQGSGGKVRNKIYEIAGSLGLNVLTNVLVNNILSSMD